MPPLSRFPPTRVYAGHNFFPLADQFLLIPRQFAQAVFTAVNLCYNCGVLEAQVKSGIPAQTESFLRLALQRAGVPFGYFEFPVVIVRSNEGGVCGVLHPHKLTCQMLQWAGLIGLQAPADDGHGQVTTVPCTDTVNRWHRRACLEMFPPTYDKYALYTSLPQGGVGFDTSVGYDNPARSDITVGSDTHVAGGSSNRDDGGGSGRDGQKDNGGENDLQGVGRGDSGFSSADAVDEGNVVDGQFGDGRGQDKHNGRTSGGSSGHVATPPAGAIAMVSFQEATGRLQDIRRSLRELRGAIKTYATPRKPRFTHFFAHHYPFHQTGGGPHDEIAIIEGFRISESDFNRIARGLACLLSDIEREELDPEKTYCAGDRLGDCDEDPSRATIDRRTFDRGSSKDDSPDGEGGAAPIHGDGARNMLTLRTIGAEGGGLDVVNCSAVDSLRDVWISLLDHDFDPPESICRGSITPCLDRAMKSFVV